MKKLIAILACASLAACQAESNNWSAASDPCAGADNPIECRNWADAGGDVNDYLLYGMVGYMIGSSTSGQRYIYRDPGYRGTYHPRMANKYGSQQQEIKRLTAKVERQKAELRRQQKANELRRQQQRRDAAKASSSRPSSFKSSPSRPSYRPSYRPSSGGFKSGKK